VATQTAVPYPSRWEADVVLRDGRTAHLRPIRGEDLDGLQRFHQAQSAESVYLRFFAPMPELSLRDLHRFTHVDHVDRVALVITIGDQIRGVGRYDRVEGETAEVAFTISDPHHGRGLGSVLLEHLAAAARENGIHRFVAEVLPQNRKMIAVFRDAGYEVNHRYEDGVISLSFHIDPSAKLREVMEAREHRAEARSVHALLNPTSVVLIGASRGEGTIGHRILSGILAGHYTGDLYVVHPFADAVLGVRAYRHLGDVPGDIDLAIIAVPDPAVLEVVGGCADKGVQGLLVVSGGFAEAGEQGLERQRELVALARAQGMRVVGPNSWGLINTAEAVRLNVSLIDRPPAPGRVGLFAQSGASSVSIMEALSRRGLGVSTFVSSGNRADVSANDCMQYWEEDEDTDVVGMYLESMGNPRKFSRIARRLSRTKPVIVVKSGRSGFVVPPGHEVRASLAPRQAFDALLAQSGCIRVENIRQLFDIAQFMTTQPLPAGPRVAVVANSHALAVLIADELTGWDLQLARPPAVVAALASAPEFRSAMDAAFADEGVDAVVAAFVPPLATRAAELTEMLSKASSSARQPVVACLLGMSGVRDALDGERTVPSYPSPEEAVRTLAAATRYQAWRGRALGIRVDPQGCDRDGAHELVDSLLRAHPAGLELDPVTAADLLGRYGIRVWPSLPVHDFRDGARAAERLGYPVALKATLGDLYHRAAPSHVRLDIGGPSELAEQLHGMRRALGSQADAGLVVQAMAPAGVACVVRSVEDPLFGPVVSFGVAGDAIDLLDDVVYRIPPLTDDDVVDLVASLRCAPKLFGHRAATAVDVQGLYDVITRVSCLADDLPEVAQLELRPVMVAEHEVCVLGARVRLVADAGRTEGGVRAMSHGR
jgi:acyl-CoA synthetase (NDP forming)/RimJ/RimL family protein N-acetyltransferase